MTRARFMNGTAYDRTYLHHIESYGVILDIRTNIWGRIDIREGDIFLDERYRPGIFSVRRVSLYDSFDAMLETEGLARLFPGQTREQAFKQLDRGCAYGLGSAIRNCGIYVFELEQRSYDFVRASNWLNDGVKNYNNFLKLLHDSYMIVRDTLVNTTCRNSHPYHRNVTNVLNEESQVASDIFDGELEIISACIDDEMLATIFLTNATNTGNLSVLSIKPYYRKRDVVTALFQKCVE